MENIKKGDFIEVEYDGFLKEGNFLFDTTNEEKAKKEGIFSKGMTYGPIIICVGEQQLLKSLDDFIIGKNPGNYDVELDAANAFGKKDAKLLKMIPSSVFKKQDVKPMPGLQVEIDGLMGRVINVTGGRIIVDFNHPLSGKDIYYKLKINKIITDDNEKLKSFINLTLGLKDAQTEIKEGRATVKIKNSEKIPAEIKNKIADRIKELIESIKEIEFTAG
jgi:FKBP-type peptidyl-prolyl cis-trans isomerase SlyD